MTQKIKHIVTVGTSSVINFKTARSAAPSRAADLFRFIDEAPRIHSAELNALIPFINRGECDTVHLVGSNTPDGSLAREALGQWLQSSGIHHTFATFDPPGSEDADPYTGLLNLVLQAARPVDGRTVLINATGGFKGQSITAVLAAQLLNLPAYYIFESMVSPVFLPTMQPTPHQREHVRLLKNRTSVTNHAALSDDDLISLERAGLVFLQRRADGGISSAKLSAYADLMLSP